MTATNTLKATAAYTFGNALQRGLAFLLLPFFTRVVTPAQYGQLSVAFSITGVAFAVMGFGFELTVYRSFFQLSDEPEAQERYVQSAWRFLIAAPIAITIVVSLVSLPLLAGATLITPLIMFLALAGAATNVAATRVPFSVLRAEQRLGAFMTISVGAAVLTSLSSVLAVVILHTGVIGWLTAVIIGNVLELALAMWVLPFRWRATFDYHDVVSSIRLGIPLVPHYVSQWSLQLADRLLLATLVTTSALGVYSLGANLAVPVMVLVSSVSQALLPTYAHAGAKRESLNELSDVIALQAGIVVAITAAGALLAPSAIALLTPREYAGAADVAPWIVLGYGFLGFYSIPMGLAGLTVGRTQRIWIITLTAALINLGLIWWFVPQHGIESAAIASAVGYAFLFLGASAYARRVGNPARIPWRRIAAILLPCALTYTLAVATTSADTVVGSLERLAWCGVIVGAVATMTTNLPSRLAKFTAPIRSR
jgi:O-antigen/teichoic acid export membrane protein